jgi:DnaJ family protein C protein 28
MSTDRQPPSSKEALRRTYREEQEGRDKASPPRDWQSRIEEEIAKIDIDALAGKGKPLDLSSNPYLDPSDALAQDLLKNAGFTLPWIDDAKHIDAALEAARRKLERARDEYLDLRDAQICSGHDWVEGSWQASLREFRKDVEQINREIRDYNLKAPSVALHKFSVRVDEELARLGVDDSE